MAKWTFEPGHTAAEFRARHMMVTYVRGHFKDVHGSLQFDPENPNNSSVEVKIDARKIWTGVKERDDHLRSADFLDVEHHPDISFKGNRVEINGEHDYAVTGDLTIRGVTRKVVFTVEGPSAPSKDPWGNTRVGFSATTKINRKDFGLTWNAALETGGILVSDEVTISLDVQAVKS